MKILRAGAYENFYDMPLAVNWILTNRCNYRCSYCFDRGGVVADRSAKKPFSTLAQFEAAVENIASLNRPWYDVKLGGGEPTIHPHISELLVMLHENLKERLNSVIIISNGSRNAALYEKIAELAKSMYIVLRISLHTDHVDMNHILELIENLSTKVQLRFTLMFNPAKREFVHSIYKTMFECRKNFQFTMNVVTLRDGDIVDKRYTQEDFAWQKKALDEFEALEKSLAAKFPEPRKPKHPMPKTFFEVVDMNANTGNLEIKIVESKNRTVELAEGLLQFKGMFCVAHAALLRINENGSCRGMVCGADPIICNIYEKNSLLAVHDKLIHLVQCPKKNCGCISDDQIPKFAFLPEALRFSEIVQAKQDALFAARLKSNALIEISERLQLAITNENF